MSGCFFLKHGVHVDASSRNAHLSPGVDYLQTLHCESGLKRRVQLFNTLFLPDRLILFQRLCSSHMAQIGYKLCNDDDDDFMMRIIIVRPSYDSPEVLCFTAVLL